jgi:outer membrane protein OmpA-like peptidoglycan-associated protein
MTRNSLLLCTAVLFVAASPQATLSEPMQDGIRLAQAAAPPAEEKERRPPGQRPVEGAPAAPGARPPATNAPPGRGPATAQPAPQQPPRPGAPPATAQTPPGQAQPAPPATAQTPPGQLPGQPPRPGAPPATAQTPPGQPPHVPGQAQTPPGQPPRPGAPPATAQTPAGQPPHVPGQAQTPPGQPPRPGAPATQQNVPATAQTPPGQPARPGAAPGQQPALANPNVRQPQPPAPVAGQPAAPGAVAAPGALPQRPGAPAPVVANAPVDPRSLPHHLDQLRNERQQVQVGNQTVIREANRTIIREGGHEIIRHDEADRFRFNAREVNVERHGNNTVTVVLRPDGARIITEVDENGRLLRRVRRDAAGREVILIDNGFEPRGPGLAGFVVELPAPVIRVPRELYIREAARATADDIYLTLMAPPVDRLERRYGLDEILYSEPLRARMPRVDVDTLNFETGSWEITPDQSDRLAFVAQSMMRAIQRNPQEMFLVEGYTDAVGNDVDNLSLSDRRAESVAVLLTNQFGVPAENLTTQGYGKQFLKVPTDAPERANRRVAVRRITPLLGGGQS